MPFEGFLFGRSSIQIQKRLKGGSREKKCNFSIGFPYGCFRVDRPRFHYGALEHGSQSV